MTRPLSDPSRGVADLDPASRERELFGDARAASVRAGPSLVWSPGLDRRICTLVVWRLHSRGENNGFLGE
jgi:hypothetical protein